MNKKNKFTVCHLLYEEFPHDPRVRRYVKALNEQGKKCIIICSKKKGDKFFEEYYGNHIYRIPVAKRRSSFFITFFEYTIFTIITAFLVNYLGIKYRFKLIHVHTLPDSLVFAAVLNKIFGAKIILDLHEIFPELYMARSGKGESSFNVKLIKLTEKISLKLADRLITIHDNAKDIFISRNKGIENKITIVMNGVDPADFIETERKESAEFVIIYNGTINKIMNLTSIVEALNILRKNINAEDFRKIKFRLYGEGPCVEEILILAEKLDLKKNVEFMGFIPLLKMHEEVLKAGVCVLPPLKKCLQRPVLHNKAD